MGFKRFIGFESAKGARYKSLGQRPREAYPAKLQALKARNETSGLIFAELRQQLLYAPSALPVSVLPVPGALPQAATFRAFGALTVCPLLAVQLLSISKTHNQC